MRPALPVVLALSVSAVGCGGSQPSPTTPIGPGRGPTVASGSANAAGRFLARYVTSDGRVIRRDQGGDIVSEGQAYGMLLAEAANKPGLARTIWLWTSTHLGRPDGLLAWHATGTGHVIDPQSATDADILIAYALLRYAGPDQAALHSAGRRIARSVLAIESVSLPDGAPLPVAGPWAKSASPPVVNPSYLMPGIFAALARLTGDERWDRAAGTAIAMTRGLTEDGRRLPPDWAQLSGGRLAPIAKPGGGGGEVQYSLDAARTPIWFATACDGAARQLAASWWRNVLQASNRPAAQALTLRGATINPQANPLTLFASAAASSAAGAESAAGPLRTRAEALALRSPTYYGDAWAALAPALLERTIDPCAG